MKNLLALWHRTPSGYLGLAAASGVLLLYFGSSTPIVYGTFGNGFDGPERFAELGGLATLLTALAPAVALASVGWAIAAAAALPALLALFGDTHEWPITVFVSLVAVALVRQWDTPRGAWLIGLSSLLAPISLFAAGTMVVPDGADVTMTGSEWPYILITTALFAVPVAIALGLGLRFRGRVAVAEEGRVALARAGEVEEHAAVVAERSRLARDLHDVVAHHVSLIAVRAETAPYTQPDLQPAARTLLADIAADARLALDELRGVLGILGRAEEGGPRAPQPTWEDIGALAGRTRSSGTVVMLSGDDGGAEVGAAGGYAAYRVVQEALTNARKHAPGRPVSVRLSTTPDLAIARISTPLRGETPVHSGGHGLAGMRERVEALGGTLSAGPSGDEFVVEAVLPRNAR